PPDRRQIAARCAQRSASRSRAGDAYGATFRCSGTGARTAVERAPGSDADPGAVAHRRSARIVLELARLRGQLADARLFAGTGEQSAHGSGAAYATCE